MGSSDGSEGPATTGAELTVKVSGALLAVELAESVTVKTRPLAVIAVAESVPEIAPVDELRSKLSGSVPAVSAQLLYGGVPPVAARVTPGYGAVASPEGKELVLTTRGGALTWRVNDWVDVPVAASVIVTLKLKLPA